jgi:hypothetical protein
LFGVAIKLSLSKTFGCLNFETNIISKLVATNPDRVTAHLAGLILQNLVSLKKEEIELGPRVSGLLMEEHRHRPHTILNGRPKLSYITSVMRPG